MWRACFNEVILHEGSREGLQAFHRSLGCHRIELSSKFLEGCFIGDYVGEYDRACYGETGSLDNSFYILLVKAGVFCRAF